MGIQISSTASKGDQSTGHPGLTATIELGPEFRLCHPELQTLP